MKNRIVILIFVSLLSSINCFAQDKNVLTKQEYQRIYHLPDSLLTKNEQALRVKLYDLLMDHMFIEGKKMYTDLKESDFKKKEIPLFYYEEMVETINKFNAFCANDPTITVDKAKAAVLKLKKEYGRYKEKGMKK